jgi:hypothetical protein
VAGQSAYINALSTPYRGGCFAILDIMNDFLRDILLGE